MKKQLIAIFLIFCAIIFTSCKNEVQLKETSMENIEQNESKKNNEINEMTNQPSDSYDVNADNKKSLEDAGIKEEVVDISYSEKGFVPIDAIYPKLTSDDPLVQKSLDVVNEDTRKFAEEFKREMSGIDNSGEEIVDKENYRFSTDNTDVYVTCFNDKYLSLRVFTYTDYMGAHPSYSIAGYVFDRQTGNRLKLYDVINDKEKFRKHLYDWCDKNKEEAGLFDEYKEVIDSYVDEKPLYEDVSTEAPVLQFCMYEDDKMTVMFQTYDIAPYAAGIISIDIPKELLK